MAKFYVNCQHYYYSGLRMVEIAMGGADMAGADQVHIQGLPLRELGGNVEYTDPREAVEAAIRIQRWWKRTVRKNWHTKAEKRLPPAVHVSLGANAGMGLEFEPMTHAELHAKAEELYAKLPKCEHCNELMGEEQYGNDFTTPNYPFCSERCAEAAQVAEISNNVIANVQEQLTLVPVDGTWSCKLGEYGYTVTCRSPGGDVLTWEVDPKTHEIREEE